MSEKSNDEEGATMMNTDLLPRAVHDLVVCTTEYSPVTGEGRMRDDEVTRQVAVGIPYFYVVDAGTVSWRGLFARTSTIRG